MQLIFNKISCILFPFQCYPILHYEFYGTLMEICEVYFKCFERVPSQFYSMTFV